MTGSAEAHEGLKHSRSRIQHYIFDVESVTGSAEAHEGLKPTFVSSSLLGLDVHVEANLLVAFRCVVTGSAEAHEGLKPLCPMTRNLDSDLRVTGSAEAHEGLKPIMTRNQPPTNESSGDWIGRSP